MNAAAPLSQRQNAVLIVPGMGSDHCAGLVSQSLKRLQGVAELSTSIASHKVHIEFDAGQTDLDALKQAVEQAGYQVGQGGAGRHQWRTQRDRGGGAVPARRLAAHVASRRAHQPDHADHGGADVLVHAPGLSGNGGIAIGTGADVAMEAADVILIGGRLSGLVEAAQLSRLTFRKIVENLLWASAYNVAAIPIAAVGLLHPMIGVIAMTVSSLSVIANSLLLKRAPLGVIRKTH